MRLQKVKDLISDGKTQQAIDLLQEILKDKNTPLLNQTFLLEGQYKDLVKKMQLGLEDATAELNRINFTLLSVCDDASELPNIGDDAPEKPFSEDEKPTGLLANPLAIFGIIAVIGIAIVFGIVLLGNKAKTVVQPLPLPNPTDVTSNQTDNVHWVATPLSATISERYYGHVKADIIAINATDKDANNKIVTLDFKFNCLKSSSGVCILNYLEFRLVSPNGNADAPVDDIYFANNPKDGTALSNKISFILPKNQNQADLQIYYRDKKANTLVSFNLNKLN